MLTVREIKRITKGVLVQGKISSAVTGVSIDSRKIKRGNVFIAVKGARFDGHDFIRGATRNGATTVIVSRKIACSKDITVIRVADTTTALGQIAAWHRNQFRIPVIAITGSTGKTTAKEMIASVLGKQFNILKNVGTQNNQYGVPLTLLKLNSSHQAAVLELGTNQPGDIRWLAKITRPTISIFTNIGESHLERLKSPVGVFLEKARLIKYMEPDGTIIANGDDRYLANLSRKHKRYKIIRFGCSGNVDYRASHINVLNNRCLYFKVKRHVFKINTSAIHNVYNALAAISCGLVCKIRYNDIITALNCFRFSGGRQEIKKIGRLWLIDDTYNANPMSLKSAISTLDTLQIKGKRIVICADMLELGPRSVALHRSAGEMIGRSNTDVVLTIGRYARYITQGLNQSKGGIKALHCRDLGEVRRRLKWICCRGDAVLVKGSRGMHMERVVAFLNTSFRKSS
ncbi:MAG: UDP-N-acetylmuramoyl-tripeptide--D-alanyl-D-alanine ligase [Candidatus Omnitrophica bacterium]|nr:UDP-N-acetylmuramoyl-tripeptide--D-alanyl-D-alanine ligase [Candidatus Omnitrophota bacterium]